MNTMKATCWFAEVTEVSEVIDNRKYWGQKAKDIKATEAKDIEVTEAIDIEVGKAIEVPEVAEFFESLEASAQSQIDTLRKEQKKYFFQNSILSTSQQTWHLKKSRHVQRKSLVMSNFLMIFCLLCQKYFFLNFSLSNLSTSQQAVV